MTAKTTTPKRQTGSEIIKVLEATWREIVKRHPELPEVVIITGSGLSMFGAKWAHFSIGYHWVDKGDHDAKRPEMFIAGERLACGGELTLQSMLHEATHAIAAKRGIQDCSRQGRYHNGEFRKIASELGLEYPSDSPDKSIGFSAVTLTEATKTNYANTIKKLDAAINTYLPGFEGLGSGAGGGDGAHKIPGTGRKTKAPGTPNTNNIKYVCECETPRIMRMAKSTFEIASVSCGDCGADFHEAK